MPNLQHLLLVTLEHPSDPKSWSGIPHSLLRALESQLPRVTVVSGAQLRPRRTPIASALRLALGAARYPLWMTEASPRSYAERLLNRDRARRPGRPTAYC